MKMRTKSWVLALAVGSVSAVTANAQAGVTPVANANTKVAGMARPNVLSPELAEILQAQGATPLENGTAAIPFYGYDGDGPMLPAPGDVGTDTHNVEATKTEPDKNTYLVLDHAAGADPSYDYGHHFLFQGHESSTADASGRATSFISRVNLDADGAHRVTLLADHDTNGAPISTIDGSTWDPFAGRLLFTTEDSGAPSVYQATLDLPATVDDLTAFFGHAAYEGGSVYCAAKAGELQITRALRLELLGTGIRVGTVDPGLAETEFSLVRLKGDAVGAKKVYAGMNPLTAADIAEILVWVASRPAHVNIDELIVKPVDQAAIGKVFRRKF